MTRSRIAPIALLIGLAACSSPPPPGQAAPGELQLLHGVGILEHLGDVKSRRNIHPTAALYRFTDGSNTCWLAMGDRLAIDCEAAR